MARRFVIVSNQRTGSSLLAHLLDSHPQIRCEDEILRPTTPADAIQILVRKSALYHGTTYGFMFKLGHVKGQRQPYSHKFVRYLSEQDWRLIYLSRRNLFQHAISFEYVKARGNVHHDRLSDDLPRPRVHIAIEDVLFAIQILERSHIIYTWIFRDLPHYPVVYEDDLQYPEQHQTSVDHLTAFLGLPTAEVSTDLAKSVPYDISEVIRNYTEIVAAIKGTRYAIFLNS